MGGHCEAEVRRDAVRDVAPRIAGVVTAIETPVILQEQAIGIGRMTHDLVHALAELRMLVRQEVRAHAMIAGAPRPAAVVAAIDAAGRDRDQQAIRPRSVRHDRV